jgi:hypothetical protein
MLHWFLNMSLIGGNMVGKFVKPEELLKSTEVTEEIRRDDNFFVAVIQKSETNDFIQVCQIGVGDWIDVPVKMIASAKIVGSASANGNLYKVALIKLNEPIDPFAKVAYRLLSQLGTIPRQVNHNNDCCCKCHKENRSWSSSSAQTVAQARNVSVHGGIGGGLGIFGIGGDCRFRFECYPCVRCIPWTDICWDSTCCDLVSVDCGIGT